MSQQGALWRVLGVVVPLKTGALHVIFRLVVVPREPETFPRGNPFRKLFLFDWVEASWRIILGELWVDVVSGFTGVLISLIFCDFVILFNSRFVTRFSLLFQRVSSLAFWFGSLLEGVFRIGGCEGQKVIRVNDLAPLLHYSKWTVYARLLHIEHVLVIDSLHKFKYLKRSTFYSLKLIHTKPFHN